MSLVALYASTVKLDANKLIQDRLIVIIALKVRTKTALVNKTVRKVQWQCKLVKRRQNVTKMNRMFMLASSFNGDVIQWKTGKCATWPT